MERKIGLFSDLAFANASSPQGYQSTGLFACCKRYGLFSPARRLRAMRPVLRQLVSACRQFRPHDFRIVTLGGEFVSHQLAHFFVTTFIEDENGWTCTAESAPQKSF